MATVFILFLLVAMVVSIRASAKEVFGVYRRERKTLNRAHPWTRPPREYIEGIRAPLSTYVWFTVCIVAPPVAAFVWIVMKGFDS